MILIILASFIIRMVRIDQSLWLDEAAQAIESARPLSQQLDISGDFWPPLYHILLHFWISFGRSEEWLRLLSVIFGVVTVYVTYLFAKKITSHKTALFAVILLGSSPFHVWYSQEIRPYALSALLGLFATYFLFNKKWLIYAFISCAFLYTIYLAPFLLFAHGICIYIFEKKHFSQWLITVSLAVVFFLPWLPQYYNQISIGRGLTVTLPGWSEVVSTPLLKVVPLVFLKFLIGRISFDNKFLYGVVGLLLFLFIAHISYQAFQKNKRLFGIISLFIGVPFIAAFLVSIWLPILAPQRLLFTLPFFYILISLGVMTQKKHRVFLVGFLLVIHSYSLYLYWTQPRFQREQWRQSIHYVENNRTSSSLALFAFPDAFAPWQWYTKNMVKSVGVAPTFVIDPMELKKFDPVISRADRLFVYHYLMDLTDPYKYLPRYLRSLGFIEVKTRDFPGVGFITIYEKAVAYY